MIATAASATAADTGATMYRLIERLYPIGRSLTGNGVRETLRILQERIPLRIVEVPSGTRVLDWTVPREWNVREAWIANERGERVVDYAKSNLHLVGYSTPVRARLTLDQLKPHLYSIPEHPDWIPYRTSYWEERWGFCLSHNDLLKLKDGEYEVCIDATLEDGALTFGECVLEGATADEVLIHTHICHPSLCNDNLSGIAVATELARQLADGKHRYSYRFLFLPGTIGAITWLALNEERVSRIRHGLVLSNLGDAGSFTYKRSRRGNAVIDRVAAHVLAHWPGNHDVRDFEPYGYDERQYCSPGFDLPVGCLSRSRWGSFPQYHTSADNLDFVRPEHLAGSLDVVRAILDVLERNARYENLSPKGEPQLGRRGLYGSLGGSPATPQRQSAMLWVLSFCDRRHTLLDIAERSGIWFVIHEAATALESAGLLRRRSRCTVTAEPEPEPVEVA